MKELYKEAKDKNLIVGHKIPIKLVLDNGMTVYGGHTLNNLELITVREQNDKQKSNSFDEDILDDMIDEVDYILE